MRKDTNKDLDLLFREALEDAAVKAPRGAWKAVSARLASAAPAAAAAPRRSWLLWGAPAFAFAAAAIAAVLYVGTTEKTIIESGEQIIAAVDQPSGPVAQAVEEPVTVAPAAKSSRAGFVPKEIQTPDQISVLPDTFVMSDSDLASQTTDQVGGDDQSVSTVSESSAEARSAEGGESVMPAPNQASNDQVADDKQSSQDFWNAIEAEESAGSARPARRVALQAGGIVGGNDEHFNSTRTAFSSGLPSAGLQETSVSIYGIPVSFGIGARYHFAEKLAVSAGVDWSFLVRTFQGKYKTAEGTFTHNMQYIGVPVSLSYDVVDSKTLLFYCYAGGSIEKAISSKYYIYADSAAPIFTEKVPSLQYGVFGGLGVEFRVSDLIGLYVDPSVKYYFPGDQPKSIRTDKPLMFSVEAGIRFNL
ncbi:MAG: outer membrane beta-barrel protein [Bacteroidales bacterium]|nr:outer membrane beta-barrel protein [Bacteroidales bacterium]